MVRNVVPTSLARFLRLGERCLKFLPPRISQQRIQFTCAPVFIPLLVDMPDGIKWREVSLFHKEIS